MTDILISPQNGIFDLSITERDLTRSEGLENAILISLFTDGRANIDDELPVDDGDRRGWWGDAFPSDIDGQVRPIGSKLWLLSRSKITQETLNRAQSYAAEALKWLVDDDLVAKIEVTTTRHDPRGIGFEIIITRHNGKIYKFTKFWSIIDGLAA